MSIALRRVACLALVFACSATAPASPQPASSPPQATPPAATAPASPEPASSPPQATPPATSAPASPAPPVEPTFCAEVGLGLDLRVLPTDSDPGHIDLFMRGEAQDLRDVAPGAPPPDVRHTPGTGVLQATFAAGSASAALARCRQAVDAYLKIAPRLPVLMTSAAHATTPCRPCDPAAAP